MAEGITLKRYYIKQMLYSITGASNISINSRGGNIDARDLKVIEQFMGHEFVGIDGANPNAPAAEILKKVYTNIENQYYNILNLHAGLGGYLESVYKYTNESGQETLDLSLLNYIIDSKISNGENVESLIYDLGIYLKSFDDIHGTSLFNDYSARYSNISSCYNVNVVELTNSSNTFIGTTGDDNFKGTNNIDYVYGKTGNDTLYGESGNDMLYGNEGNDNLYGEYGNDILDGGIGNDYLSGNDGDDTYIFGLGYGVDTIGDGSGLNTIKFLEGIKPEDILVTNTGNYDVTLSIRGTTGKINISSMGIDLINNVYEFNSNCGNKAISDSVGNDVIKTNVDILN